MEFKIDKFIITLHRAETNEADRKRFNVYVEKITDIAKKRMVKGGKINV